MPKKTTVSVPVDSEQLAQLQNWAKTLDRSVANVIRYGIDLLFKTYATPVVPVYVLPPPATTVQKHAVAPMTVFGVPVTSPAPPLKEEADFEFDASAFAEPEQEQEQEQDEIDGSRIELECPDCGITHEAFLALRTGFLYGDDMPDDWDSARIKVLDDHVWTCTNCDAAGDINEESKMTILHNGKKDEDFDNFSVTRSNIAAWKNKEVPEAMNE